MNLALVYLWLVFLGCLLMLRAGRVFFRVFVCGGGEVLVGSVFFREFGRPVNPNLLVSLSIQSVPVSRKTRRKKTKGALNIFDFFLRCYD